MAAQARVVVDDDDAGAPPASAQRSARNSRIEAEPAQARRGGFTAAAGERALSPNEVLLNISTSRPRAARRHLRAASA
jgi:hypothetical protein